MEKVNFTNEPEFWKVATNGNHPLFLKFDKQKGNIDETIFYLQNQLELFDSNIRNNYINQPVKQQTRYIEYYRDMKEVYGNLLHACYNTKLK